MKNPKKKPALAGNPVPEGMDSWQQIGTGIKLRRCKGFACVLTSTFVQSPVLLPHR
jgi:hypothetical protein